MVANHIVMRGTQLGAFQGISPTGRTVEVTGTNLMRFESGRIAETWGYLDTIAEIHSQGLRDCPGRPSGDAQGLRGNAIEADARCRRPPPRRRGRAPPRWDPTLAARQPPRTVGQAAHASSRACRSTPRTRHRQSTSPRGRPGTAAPRLSAPREPVLRVEVARDPPPAGPRPPPRPRRRISRTGTARPEIATTRGARRSRVLAPGPASPTAGREGAGEGGRPLPGRRRPPATPALRSASRRAARPRRTHPPVRRGGHPP